MPSSRASSCASARSARSGVPASTPRPPRSSCLSPASVTSSTPPDFAKSAPGESIRMSWAPAFRNSGPISINAASTTAAIWSSRGARCGARRRERSIPIAWCRTSGSTRKSSSLPGPAAGVAGGDLGHHLGERVVEVDLLRVGQAHDHEQDISELHRDRAFRLIRLLLLRPEPMIHLARQLSHLLGEPSHVGERREIALFKLADPAIHYLLRVAEAHGL